MGDLAQFQPLLFPEAKVREISDVRLRMTNERQETLAFGVVGTINGIIPFTNYGTMEVVMNQDTLSTVSATPTTTVGPGISSAYYRFIVDWLPDPAAAVDDITHAIELDSGNPVLYEIRAFGHYRNENLNLAREDVNTALELGPKGWTYPEQFLMNDALYFQNDFALASQYADTILKQVPDELYTLTVRSLLNYLQGNYAAAREGIRIALESPVHTNLPYAIGISFALRDADFEDALSLVETMRTLFPDPKRTERSLLVTFGQAASQFAYVRLNSALGNAILGRWQTVLDDVQQIIEAGTYINADVHYLRGFAECNLKDYASAEEAYTKAIELEPNFTLLYFLRAEVRRNQGNILGAGQDLAQVIGADQSASFQVLLNAAAQRTITCENFLQLKPEDFAGIKNTATATPQ